MCARVVVRSVFKQSRSPVGSISKEWETVIERECFYTIERSVFIKLVRKLLSSCVIAALLVFPAQAATSEEIQQQIDSAIEKQNMAHQIAEYVRSFGESEDNPAILLLNKYGFDSDTKRIINESGKYFFEISPDEMEERLLEYNRALEKKIENETLKYQEKRKVVYPVGMLGGIMLVIILL